MGLRLPRPGRVLSSVDLLIPFHDTDPLQIVWHGNYFKYFEVARTALEGVFNIDLVKIYDLGYVFPVVESHCRHLSPLRYGDRASCRAWVVDVDRKFKVGYDLFNETTNRRSAEGWTVQVALDRQTSQMLWELPDEILEKIRGAGGV